MDPTDWGVDPRVEGYLLTACQNMGWVLSGGFGVSVLPWAEIKAYADCTGELKEPWEFQAVRDISAAYLHASQMEEDVDDPANWVVYKGLMLPMVLPRDRGRVRVAKTTVEM